MQLCAKVNPSRKVSWKANLITVNKIFSTNKKRRKLSEYIEKTGWNFESAIYDSIFIQFFVMVYSENKKKSKREGKL